jgi:hypothetical protein
LTSFVEKGKIVEKRVKNSREPTVAAVFLFGICYNI